MKEPLSAPLGEWYSVGFDDRAIALQVSPPNGIAWQETILWERIIRVCFKTGDRNSDNSLATLLCG